MPGRTVRTVEKRKLEEPVVHVKYFDGLSLPTRLKRPGVELQLDRYKSSKKIRLSERAHEKKSNATIGSATQFSAKTSTPVQVASPLLTTIAQAGAAGLTATHHRRAFGVCLAEKTAHTAKFDDSAFVVVEYTLYNEVKHGDKNSARLLLCNGLEANESGEFEGGDDEFDDEFEGDGEYSEGCDEDDE